MGKLKDKLYRNKWINKFFTDKQFNATVLLYFSLAFNFVYAVWEIISGIYYKSYWFMTLGCYYVLLAFIRLLLVKGTRQDVSGIRYRVCGVSLLLMNFILIGIVVLVTQGVHGVKPFAGYLIYAMAAYTFYKIVAAIINMVKYRKFNNRAVYSSKVICLAAAIISMLSLAIAMIIQFGGGEEFLRTMTISLGSVSAVVISIMAVIMIITARKVK